MSNAKRTTEEMHRLSVADYRSADKLPLVVVLDNVRSQHNVAEIHKTALGAEESVDWQYFHNTLDAVRDLQAHGYTVYAVEQAHNSVTLEDVAESLTGEAGHDRIAVVLGHEVFGVQQEVIDLCNQCIEIPQYGTKHSMNVSVTAGIVMYRLASSLRLRTSR